MMPRVTEVGGASHDQWQCMCVFLQSFGHVTWIHVEVMQLFVTGHSHYHTPIARWHKQLISCPLTHVQPFHWILCKSMNPFGRNVFFVCLFVFCFFFVCFFCNRPLPLTRPLLSQLAWTQTHTFAHMHTLNLHPKSKNCGHQRMGNFCGLTDRATCRAACCS